MPLNSMLFRSPAYRGVPPEPDLAAAKHRTGLSAVDEAIRRRIHMLPIHTDIRRNASITSRGFLMRGS
ncbi:hypothetical protein IQ26_05754 [Mesorhizobium tianshanense]|uniref:Uncharacterized protein n=1 Tax=Mesorhizobium tianshanense TaxID=39844 RepID=A0A562N433_9HYPH|nr:hypothetical protein IQ26_05754 [Mesorhizobium tianshanense]